MTRPRRKEVQPGGSAASRSDPGPTLSHTMRTHKPMDLIGSVPLPVVIPISLSYSVVETNDINAIL